MNLPISLPQCRRFSSRMWNAQHTVCNIWEVCKIPMKYPDYPALNIFKLLHKTSFNVQKMFGLKHEDSL